MRNIAIIDDSFDSGATPDYRLMIQYSGRYCSFAILDSQAMKYIAFKNFWFTEPVEAARQADHIRNLLHRESYLTRKFLSVSLMYVTPVSVLVPSPLFAKEKPESYFRFSSEIRSSDKIIYRKIPSIDAYILFPVPEDFVNQANIMLRDVQFFHQLHPQIDLAKRESAGSPHPSRVFAGIGPGFVDLTVIRADQVLLANSYEIKNTGDLLYFILYMYETFGLSQEETPLYLSGFPELFDGAGELLNTYLKRTVLLKFPKGFSYSQVFKDLPQHQYSPLIYLAGCE